MTLEHLLLFFVAIFILTSIAGAIVYAVGHLVNR